MDNTQQSCHVVSPLALYLVRGSVAKQRGRPMDLTGRKLQPEDGPQGEEPHTTPGKTVAQRFGGCQAPRDVGLALSNEGEILHGACEYHQENGWHDVVLEHVVPLWCLHCLRLHLQHTTRMHRHYPLLARKFKENSLLEDSEVDG